MKPVRLTFLRLVTILVVSFAASQAWADNQRANATVSFGAWMNSPPLDRFPNTSNTRLSNHHIVSPNAVSIKAGGTVNFIVSGFHNIAIYDDGTEPEDIDTTQLVTTTGVPNDIPIINDATNRIYRGLDPTLQPIDRVEVVKFDEPGTYLVICGILPHFSAGMYGYVIVLP